MTVQDMNAGITAQKEARLAALRANDTRKTDFFKRAYDLGKLEGDGKNSRPDFGFEAFLAAADGVIVSGKDDNDDVKPLYSKYLGGLGKHYDFAGMADGASNEKSVKSQVSKLRQCVIVGGLPMFLTSRDGGENKLASKWLTLVKERITELAKVSPKAVPVYDKFVSVMRAQRGKFKTNKTEPLTADEIDAAIVTSAPNPEELKLIKTVFNRIGKLMEDPLCAGSLEYLEAAAKALAPRVAQLETAAEDEEMDEQLASLTPEQKAKMLARLAA